MKKGEIVMRKLIYTLLCGTVALGLTAGFVQGQERRAKDELDDRAQTVNALADKRGGMREALHDVSIETGVPMEELQAMRDKHPDVGPAGILIASVLADNTKKPAEQFLSRHVNGKGWAAIARDNDVPLDKINERLSHLERELSPPTEPQRERRRY